MSSPPRAAPQADVLVRPVIILRPMPLCSLSVSRFKTECVPLARGARLLRLVVGARAGMARPRPWSAGAGATARVSRLQRGTAWHRAAYRAAYRASQPGGGGRQKRPGRFCQLSGGCDADSPGWHWLGGPAEMLAPAMPGRRRQQTAARLRAQARPARLRCHHGTPLPSPPIIFS